MRARASILSAGSMFSWNVYHRLLAPRGTTTELRRVIRGSIILLGVAAMIMALDVRSVAELWFFTADLVFVLLFPRIIVGPVRSACEPLRLDRRVFRFARATLRGRASACRLAGVHSVRRSLVA